MPLPAPHLRLVQAAVKMANDPELSLRGGQRPTWRPEREARGSALGVQSREGSSVFAAGSPVIGPDSARFPRRFAPRNDKLESFTPQNAYRRYCQPAWRSMSAATDAIGWCVFIGGRCGLQVPPRDCTPRALPRASRSGRHVGLRPPRNDKFRGIAPLNLFRNHCQPAWRSLTAATDAIGLYVFIVSLFLALVRSRARLSAPLHFPLRCRKIPPGRVFIPAGM